MSIDIFKYVLNSFLFKDFDILGRREDVVENNVRRVREVYWSRDEKDFRRRVEV